MGSACRAAAHEQCCSAAAHVQPHAVRLSLCRPDTICRRRRRWPLRIAYIWCVARIQVIYTLSRQACAQGPHPGRPCVQECPCPAAGAGGTLDVRGWARLAPAQCKSVEGAVREPDPEHGALLRAISSPCPPTRCLARLLAPLGSVPPLTLNPCWCLRSRGGGTTRAPSAIAWRPQKAQAGRSSQHPRGGLPPRSYRRAVLCRHRHLVAALCPGAYHLAVRGSAMSAQSERGRARARCTCNRV